MKHGTLDLVICDGGLMGLTLAIQLKRAKQDMSICILERQASPLPHKVGESPVVMDTDRQMAVKMGVELIEEVSVREVDFRNGTEDHIVHYERLGVAHAIRCRWVIDPIGAPTRPLMQAVPSE